MVKKHEMRSYEFDSKLRGEWLVVSDNKVVAHGNNLQKILELAEKYPEKNTIVTKALSGQACFF